MHKLASRQFLMTASWKPTAIFGQILSKLWVPVTADMFSNGSFKIRADLLRSPDDSRFRLFPLQPLRRRVRSEDTDKSSVVQRLSAIPNPHLIVVLKMTAATGDEAVFPYQGPRAPSLHVEVLPARQQSPGRRREHCRALRALVTEGRHTVGELPSRSTPCISPIPA